MLGRYSFIFDAVNHRTCNVQPFDPGTGIAKKVPIVDGALANDCPYTHKAYLLAFKNALHVLSVSHNLIPPFIMREARSTVNDTA
jgi:hypothetical protein